MKYITHLKTIIFALIIIAAHTSTAVTQNVSLPGKWKHLVPVMQTRNTVGDESDFNIIPIYHIDVLATAKELEVIRSKHLDVAMEKVVLIKKDGKPHVRIFFKDKRLFRGAQQEYWGTKMPSHNTYFVWNPKRPKQQPVYMKFESEEGDNQAVNVKQSIANNDVVEFLLEKNNDKSISYLPERLGVIYKDYAFSTRSVEPVGVILTPDQDLLALHAVFSREESDYTLDQIFQLAAKVKDVSIDNWMYAEYIPKLANFIAKLTAKYGIFPAAHTQNLMMILNSKTGLIDGFVFRDMNDILVDQLAVLSDEELVNRSEILGQSVSNINRFFVDEEKPDSKFAGMNFKNYMYSAIAFDHIKLSAYSVSNFSKFIDHFVRYAELHSGVKIYTPSNVLSMIIAISEGQTNLNSHLFSFIIQDIFDQITKARVSKLAKEPVESEQQTLGKQFKKQKTENKVAYTSVNSEVYLASPLRYSRNGSLIIAQTASGGEVVGIAFGLKTSSCDGLFN